MPIFYRFEHERPGAGTRVHCFKDFEKFKGFVTMMRRQDADARIMKTWEVEGKFIAEDDGDALVLVMFAEEIHF